MEPMGNVSRIQRREKNSSSNTNNNRFKRELASAKQELVSLKERSWKYGCLLLIALFFAISLVGYIVIDKYDIINVVGVSGSGGIGSNTATNKNSAASKAGVFIVVEEVDVSHKSGEQDENETQIEIQTETTTAAVANDNDAEKNKNKNKNSDDNNNNNDDNNKKDNVVKDDNDEQSTSPVPPSKNENGSKSISIIKQKQIENYRNGTALMLNVHMVHHGGTTFCKTIGNNGINDGISPSFACMGTSDDDGDVKPSKEEWEYCHSDIGIPWPSSPKITKECIDIIRPNYHMISWEFGKPGVRPISETNWEHPLLLSVIVMRDPISRLLAGDGKTSKQYPGFNENTLNRTEWWKYATDATGNNHNTDNFFLKILINTTTTNKYNNITRLVEISNYTINKDNDNGSRMLRKNKNKNKNKNNNNKNKNKNKNNNNNNNKIDDTANEHHEITNPLHKDDYDNGVELLNRFTYVLDIQCLNEGMIELAKQLNLNLAEIEKGIQQNVQGSRSKSKIVNHSTSNRDKVGYDDVYEYLVEKNKWDIELYEYSKSISIVNCSDTYTGRV